MKHAAPQTLSRIDPLLDKLRGVPGLVEKRPGVFYRRGAAFLHFHEDPAGIFADMRIGRDWERMPTTTARARNELLRRIKDVLSARSI